MPDLTFIPTDDLVEELKRRNDAVLIVAHRSDRNSDQFFCDWRGLTTCIGLAERAKARLIQHALSPSDVEHGDED